MPADAATELPTPGRRRFSELARVQARERPPSATATMSLPPQQFLRTFRARGALDVGADQAPGAVACAGDDEGGAAGAGQHQPTVDRLNVTGKTPTTDIHRAEAEPAQPTRNPSRSTAPIPSRAASERKASSPGDPPHCSAHGGPGLVHACRPHSLRSSPGRASPTAATTPTDTSPQINARRRTMPLARPSSTVFAGTPTKAAIQVSRGRWRARTTEEPSP